MQFKKFFGGRFLVLFLLILAMTSGVFALSVTKSPTLCSGLWSSCYRAFGDFNGFATASGSKVGTWNGYGFALSPLSTVQSVMVRLDYFSPTAHYVNVQVSYDGGLTYGPSHTVGGNLAEQPLWVDVTYDYSWTPARLSNSYFRVKVTCLPGVSSSVCNLDWVPVKVMYV